MTWNQIADLIGGMSAKQRRNEAVLMEDCGGPDQRVRQIEIVQASQDVYDGISIGNEMVLSRRDWYLRTI